MDKPYKNRSFLYTLTFGLALIAFLSFIVIRSEFNSANTIVLVVLLGGFWRQITLSRHNREISSMDNLIHIRCDQELQKINNDSTAIIYKHSTTCGVSTSAMKEIKHLAQANPDITIYIVNVIEERPLSNRIAETLNIMHQSPQVILLKQGQPIWHGSHFDVTEKMISGQLKLVPSA